MSSLRANSIFYPHPNPWTDLPAGTCDETASVMGPTGREGGSYNLWRDAFYGRGFPYSNILYNEVFGMYADVLSPVSETTTRLHGPLGKESLDNKEKVKVDYPREIAVDTVAVTTDNSRGDEDHYIRREDIPKFLHPFPKPGTVSRKEWSLSPKKKEGYHRREKAIKYLHPFPKPGTISKKFDLKTDISDLLKPFPKPGMVTRRTADELLPLFTAMAEPAELICPKPYKPIVLWADKLSEVAEAEYANSSELEAYTTETLNMLKEFPYDLEEYFADDDL